MPRYGVSDYFYTQALSNSESTSFNMLTTDHRFAMTELHITLATIFRRFEFELFETTREKEIDTARDCFLAETEPGSVGVRVKVAKVLDQ